MAKIRRLKVYHIFTLKASKFSSENVNLQVGRKSGCKDKIRTESDKPYGKCQTYPTWQKYPYEFL